MATGKALTDARCKQAKHAPGGKNKLFDGGGLYLELMPSGSKKWRLKYRIGGKENRLTFGDYPAVGLADARERREIARGHIAGGTDPALLRDAERVTRTTGGENTFRTVADEWLTNRKDTWSAGYAIKTAQLLERDLFPALGHHPIHTITPSFLLAVVRKIEARGAYEMPRRALVTAGQIFRYAIGTGRATVDASAGMAAQLKPRPPVAHYPHVEEPQLPDLLARVDAYHGHPVTIAAVKLATLTFIRGGELRYAEWTEFDLDAAEWRVPSGRMKGRIWHKASGVFHIVPLPRQAVELLEELKQHSGRFDLLFPGAKSPRVPITGEAMNKVFHTIGFKGQQTVHGLRGLASTLLNESGLFDSRIIEAQLSHKEKDQTKAAYNHARYIVVRRQMMQWWADYLDGRAAGNVLEFKRPA
jgi:integrase